ncbi:hypothetical protein [Ramlibacter sp. Leaf400]|uniref:hypothetical protein n=1 Tax=Ramlibacter sp. Leaf400 TaxID=1736365 RepID=UPI0006FEFD63|nr:hypothetical protein [Ramlibacter sp. Leaf400]KQT10990.1 hypothetical protein ASG30_09335 [Ramlibacter sp. Leaf400]
MDIRAFEIEMIRLVLWYGAVSLIGFIVTMWCLYHVIRAAIRDGIRESGLVGTWTSVVARTRRESADTLPPDFSAR